MPLLNRRALLSAAALPAACAPADLLNATVSRAPARLTEGVAYGPLARQKLDIYRPVTPMGEKPPIVVFIYGGTWKTGSRGMYPFVAERLARLGCAVIVPDYRLYPEVRFPAFIEDGARAVAWTQAHASEFGDPRRIFVMGHSAGAHIAAMVAIDPAYLSAAGGDAGKLAGLIGLAGPYNFLPITDPDIVPIFFDSDPPATQPINFVHPGAPPAFLAAGSADTAVNPQNTRDLAEALRKAGSTVVEKIYPGAGHVGVIIAFAGLLEGRTPVAEDVGAFVRSQPAV